jgi:transcription antitermination protein NusB
MSKRRRSRELALSMLFQMEINKDWTVSDKIAKINEKAKGDEYISSYAIKIIDGLVKDKDKIDNLIRQFSENWSFERISIIDKSILRMAIVELYLSTPKTAVINEALEIADKYGEKESKSFVNGLLDKISFNL